MRRLRELAEDLRFLVARVSRRAPGSPRGAGRRLRRFWLGRSLTFRRRSAAVAVVLVAYLALKSVAPAMPCGLPGGECPQRDDAIALVPADVLAYAHAGLSREAAQFEQARELAERLPNFPAIAQGLFRELGPGRELDLGGDVYRWMGDEVAAVALPHAGGERQRLLLVDVGGERDAEVLAGRISGKARGSQRHGGAVLLKRADGNWSALLDGFLALGSRAAVRDAIDAARGRIPSLDEDPEAEEMRDELPGKRLADAYVSAAGVEELLGRGAGLSGALDALVDIDASEGVAAAAVAEQEGLRVELRSRRDPTATRRDPGLFTPQPRFDPGLAADFPADTLALLAIGDHAGEVRRALAEAVPPGFYNAYKGPGDRLVVSTGSRGDRREIAAEGDLASADSYRTVTADSPESLSALVFFDLSGLVRLAATRGLAEIASGFQADLAKLSALGVMVDADEDSLHTRLFLEIE